ncbi:beta strand repeat-containing protein [Cellulomonas persica]
MRIPAPLRRATAALATATLALTTLVAGLAAPAAAAAEVAFSVDDFAGNAIGTRALVPGNYSCTPSGNNTLTMGTGTMKIDARVPDSIGCNYANAQVTWTADSLVNLEQGGADRLELRYRDVTPNQPSAVSFGVAAEDVNGKVASANGLTRNGRAAGDWLTIRYAPAYVGDVAVFSFPSGFDRSRVKKITLFVSATESNRNVSVTFEGIGTNVGEPVYQAPAFAGTDALVFPPSTSTTRTVTVTGNPAPDVSVTSGKPTWMTVTTSKSGSTTTVSLSGNPGTAYADSTITLHADVANALTADATIPVVVPSPVSVTSTGATATLDTVTSASIGTATSTPASSILGPTTGLPPGTSLSMSGSDVRLTGTPTATGTYTVTTTVGNAYRTAPLSTQVVVGSEPTVAAVPDLTVARGEDFEIPITTTGYPAPTVSFEDLPAWASYADGVLSGTAPTTDGSVSVRVSVANAWGTAVDDFTITHGARPTVTAPTTTVVTAGVPTTLPLTVADVSSASATGLPAGLSVVRSSATSVAITGTPTRPTSTSEASGTATISATNPYGTATASWAWTVQAAPVIAAPASAATVVGYPFSDATFTVTGYPTPTLTTSVLDGASLPTGVSFDTSTPGVVTVVGTPTTSGTITVRVTADNGVGSPVSRDMELTTMRPPAFAQSSSMLTVAAGASESLVVEWSGYYAPTLSIRETLPSWLDFDAGTGTFVASPPAGVAGVFGPYHVDASNPAGAASTLVRVTVTAPPSIALQLGGYTGLVDADMTEWTIATFSGHPAPDIEVTDLPPGVVATVADGEVTLTGTPTATGTYSATITATNAHGTDTAQFPLEITAPASLSAPTSLAIPMGVAATLPITVGGYPRPTLEASGLPAGLVLDGAAGTVSGTPTTPGRYTVQLEVTFGSGSIGVDPVTMTLDVTAAPSFAAAPTTTTLRHLVAADVAAFTVAGHPTPTATATGLPAGLTLAQDGSSVRLVGTPAQTGTFEVTVELESVVGTDEAEWTVVVQDPATVDAPSTVTTDVDEAIAPIVVVTGGYPAPTVTADGLPDGLALVTDGSGSRIVGTPTQDGAHTVTLTADNGVGTPASTSVALHVHSTPALGADRTATFPAGTTSTLTLTPTGYPAPSLTTSALPSWLAFDSTTATFTATPDAAHQGADEAVEVTATNTAGTDTLTIDLVVTAAPSAADTDGTTTVRSGAPVDVALTTVTGHPTPTLTASGLPDGLDVALVAGELRLTGTTTATGTHDVELTLANGSAADLTVAWTVVVEAPAGLTGPTDLRLTQDDAVDETFAATGYPVPSVTAAGLPAGLSWIPATGGGRLVGTPRDPGTSTVTLTAHNGVDADAVHEVTIDVEPRAVAVALSVTSAAVGGSLDVRASGLQPDEQVEVWLHSTPRLLARTQADATGELSLRVTVPADTPVGTHTVVVEAASGAIGTATVQVLPAAAPSPTPTPTAPVTDPTDPADPGDEPAPTPAPTSGTEPDDGDDLAVTGSDVVGLLAAGLLVLLSGVVVLAVRRRRV